MSTADGTTGGPEVQATVAQDAVLVTYVDSLLADEQYTEAAVAAAVSEVGGFVADLHAAALRRKRGDGSEIVIERYVNEAANELRNKPGRKAAPLVSDWSKRFGFLFVGLTIQQVIDVRHQDPIDGGSVAWLVVLAAIATALIVTGLIIDTLLVRPSRR